MRSFWHPLSALVLAGSRGYAGPGVLRTLLRAGRTVELLYAGDRMWPAVVHGATVLAEAAGSDAPAPREAVVAVVGGIPDLFRVVGTGPAGRLRLAADADPAFGAEVAPEAVLARTPLPRHRHLPLRAGLRRLGLDLGEAWNGGPEPGDAAGSVRAKYDLQAPFYASTPGPEIEEALLGRLLGAWRRGTEVLVAGSGSGRECFALARAGFRVRGVDFAEAMVAAARRGARERGLEVEFVHTDLREHRERRGSLGGILFTYDVYSFVPEARERVRMLRRMRDWLAPRGSILLSARRAAGLYQRAMLTLQWLRAGAPGVAAWGKSHTRYIAPDGRLRRSFVHYFTARRLRDEVGRAGFRLGCWEGGYAEVTPGPSPAVFVEGPP